MDPHIKCQVVCVLLSAAPHIYGRAEQSAGGEGGGGRAEAAALSRPETPACPHLS